MPPNFFFLLWWVKSAFERLEVPSYSSEGSYSSSSSPDRLNLSILVFSAAMEQVRDLIVGTFPLFFLVPFPFPLEHQRILLVRCEIMIVIILKEPVIHCRV
jgi:hypothetical protein